MTKKKVKVAIAVRYIQAYNYVLKYVNNYEWK